jgi:hypothetical protein
MQIYIIYIFSKQVYIYICHIVTSQLIRFEFEEKNINTKVILVVY